MLKSVTLFTEPRSDAAKTFTLSIQRDPQVLVVESGLDSVDGKQSGFRAKVLSIHAQDTREDVLQVGQSGCAGNLSSGKEMEILGVGILISFLHSLVDWRRTSHSLDQI